MIPGLIGVVASSFVASEPPPPGGVVLEDYVKTDGGNNLSSITMVAPSGITAGDCLILLLHSGSTTGGDDWTTPSGWTKEFLYGSASSDSTICLMWKIADGSEGNIEFTGLFVSWQHAGWYMRLSGSDQIDPIDVVGTEDISSGSADVVADPITTLTDGCLAFASAAHDQSDSRPYSETVTGWDFRDQCWAGDGGSGGFSAAFATLDKATAGITPSATFTASRSDGNVGTQFAIKPAA